MPSYNNLNDLLKGIKNAVQDVANSEVKKTIKDTMQKHIDLDVYDQFQPTQYDRRDINAGLIADENIDININSTNNGVNITATDTAVGVDDAYGEPIIGIIETGRGYTWSHVPPPRPFLEKTKEELESGVLEQTLKQGLNKRGLKTN